MLARPERSEYDYTYESSISKVPEGYLIEILDVQINDSVALLRSIDEQKAEHRYAPGKWSIKQVVGHVIDSERIFAYRALRFARRDGTDLPDLDRVRLGPDQDGPAPEKTHPYNEVMDDLQGRMTEWLESIRDPVLQMEKIYDRAKAESRNRWRKKR
jgi:hypothetical protein